MRRRAVLKGLLLLLAGLGVYGTAVEPMWGPRVQGWKLLPRGWPKGRKLRLVMIADLHAGAPQMSESRIKSIVAKANGLGGDLILLMGDYRASHRFQTRHVPIEAVAPLFTPLRAPLGVYAILGNHDWWDDAAAQARRAGPIHTTAVMGQAGIPVLVNQALRLGQGDDAFWLAGVDSQFPFRGRSGRMDDLPATLAQVTDDAPVILLAHEPDIFPEVPDRVLLTLSGHTHGGQIRLGPWAPVVPSRFGARYAYGHIQEGGRDLVVSGGLGCSGLPIRFGMPPEITVVDLG